MDDLDKMTNLRLIVGEGDDDYILLSYLEQAKCVILDRMYPYVSEGTYNDLNIPPKYDWKQIRIAAYLMNKRGAEGELSHSENGISRSYSDSDVPGSLLADVLPMIGIPR